MKYKTDVNDVQATIMRQLFYHESLRFSQLNTDNVPSDQFSYHLRQLIKYGIVDKSPDNLYSLSVMGRSRAILLDSRSNRFIEQGFVACRVHLSREVQGARQYLMQKRARVPYKGNIAEPGGKVLFGEDIAQAAKRNMLAETGLTCDMQVHGIVHFKDLYLDRIVQDKYFFIVVASNPTGTLLPHGPTGENIWMNVDDIKTNPKTHKGVVDMIQIAQAGAFGFAEATHITEIY